MTFIPKLHILATRGQKSGFFTIFGTLWAFGPPLWAFGPNKRFHMTFVDMVKLFYFMTFIPKLHILAPRGKKSGFFTIFGIFRPFWGTSFPKKKKKKKKS